MSHPAPPPPRPLLKVERLVAQSAGSLVLLVTAPDGERLAVKEIPGTRPASSSGDLATEVARVLQLMNDLHHPQLVEWRHYSHNGERARIIRGFQDGVTLQEFVDAPQTALPLTETVGWMKQMAELVAWFHDKGIIMPRGDLKPSHFILDEWEKVRLLDLDLASLAGASSAQVPCPASSFQPWLAPELAAGGQDQAPDVRSDVYALGAVFYALLTRTPPPDSLKLARGEETLVPAHQVNAMVPAPMGELVQGMMAANPEERPPNLREVAKGLRNASRNVRRDGSSQQSHMRRCPQCRLRIARTAAECRYCALPPPTVKAITMGSPAATEQKPALPTPRSRTSVFLAAGMLALLALVALGAWWLARPDPPGAGPTRPHPQESPSVRPHRPGARHSGAPTSGEPSRREKPIPTTGKRSPAAR